MTYYKKNYRYKKENFKFAKNYADQNISLPIYPSLKNIELAKIIKTIEKFYGYK